LRIPRSRRRDPFGRTPGAWGPQWAIFVPQAIAVFTLNGARALRLEAETGSLEPGKRADFVVLDRNLLDIDPHTSHEARVLATVFDGRIVHEAEPAP
jgi:predicted amidohydrolase YtcJ